MQPMHGEMARGVAGILMVLIWLVFALGAIVGWIISLVALWRLMRAHESLAESARRALSLLPGTGERQES